MDRLVGENFNALFETFERTAFRLETREHYTVDEEADALQEFLADGRFDLGWFEPWSQTIRTITAAGRTMSRVRVVNEPPTDYQRFELAVAPANISAGENHHAAGAVEGSNAEPAGVRLLDLRRQPARHHALRR